MSTGRKLFWMINQSINTTTPRFLFQYDFASGTWSNKSLPMGKNTMTTNAAFIKIDRVTGRLYWWGNGDTDNYHHLYYSDDDFDSYTEITPSAAHFWQAASYCDFGLSEAGRIYAWQSDAYLYYRDGTTWTKTNSTTGTTPMSVTDPLICSHLDKTKLWSLLADRTVCYNGNSGTLADWVTTDHGHKYSCLIPSPHDSTILYGVYGASVYKLTSNGSAETTLYTFSPPQALYSIWQDDNHPEVLYVTGLGITNQITLWKSIDSGATFTLATGTMVSGTIYTGWELHGTLKNEGSVVGTAIAASSVDQNLAIIWTTGGSSFITDTAFTAQFDVNDYVFEAGTGTGSASKLTDTSKSWTVNEWRKYSVKDSAGTFHDISSNTATELVFTSGTPADGAYEIRYDSGIHEAGKTFQSNLIYAEPICQTITVTPSSLSTAYIGTAYSQALSATGGYGTYVYSLTTGTLPPGLTLSSAGVISGTPTAATGTYSFTVTVDDFYNCPGTKDYSITVSCPMLVLTPTSLPNGFVGYAYSRLVTASNGTSPYTYVVSSGALPTGFTLNASTGEISGTTTTAGTYSFTITVDDLYSCPLSQAYTLTITGTTPTPTNPYGSDGIMVYDERKNAWYYYDGLPNSAITWSLERKHIVLAGTGTVGSVEVLQLSGLYRYGKSVTLEAVLQFQGLNDVLRYKRICHAELLVKGDCRNISVEWEIDGNNIEGADKDIYTSKGVAFGSATGTAVTDIGDGIGYWSDDSSGGNYTRPLEKQYRFICPQGGMGKLNRMRITAIGEGELSIEEIAINYVPAP